MVPDGSKRRRLGRQGRSAGGKTHWRAASNSRCNWPGRDLHRMKYHERYCQQRRAHGLSPSWSGRSRPKVDSMPPSLSSSPRRRRELKMRWQLGQWPSSLSPRPIPFLSFLAHGPGRRPLPAAYARLGTGISRSRALCSVAGQEAICRSQTYLACMSHLRRLRQVDPEKEVSACLSIPHDLRR